jgi:hypothetical protein
MLAKLRFRQYAIFRTCNIQNVTYNRLWMKGSLHEAVSHKPQ